MSRSDTSQKRQRTYRGMPTSTAVRRTVKSVMMRNAETKRHNVTYNEAAQTTNTIGAQELTQIGQGDEISQRNGRQILASNIQLRAGIHNTSNLEPVAVKMMILQAKSGVTKDLNDSSSAIWVKARHDTATSFASIGGLQAMLYEPDPEQYTVLASKQFVLDATPYPNTTLDHARTGGAKSIKFFNKYVKLNGRKINYDGATGTTCQNPIWLVWFCVQADNDQIVGTDIEISAVCNLNYKDF